WAERAERLLELTVEAARRHRTRGLADARAAALAMRDEDGLGEPGLDRRRRVANMDHERAAADRGAVDPARRDAEIMRDLLRRLDGGGHAVDVLGLQPGILHRVQRRVGV